MQRERGQQVFKTVLVTEQAQVRLRQRGGEQVAHGEFGQAVGNTHRLMGWVTPLLWVVWALGMLCLQVPAVALHWLAGRLKTPATLRKTPLSR